MFDTDVEWTARLRDALQGEESFIPTAGLLQALGAVESSATKRRLKRCMNTIGWLPTKDPDTKASGYRPGQQKRTKGAEMKERCA